MKRVFFRHAGLQTPVAFRESNAPFVTFLFSFREMFQPTKRDYFFFLPRKRPRSGKRRTGSIFVS